MLLCACHASLAHFRRPKWLKVRNALLESQEHPDLHQYTDGKPLIRAFKRYYPHCLHITVSETPQWQKSVF